MDEISTMIVIGAVILVIILAIGAYYMSNAAEAKGYGNEYHIWPICFFLGILGYLYVISLPDLKLQKQNQELLDAMLNHSETTVEDELPEL